MIANHGHEPDVGLLQAQGPGVALDDDAADPVETDVDILRFWINDIGVFT